MNYFKSLMIFFLKKTYYILFLINYFIFLNYIQVFFNKNYKILILFYNNIKFFYLTF